MKIAEEIKNILAEYEEELRSKFHVKKLGIFGSYARNEQRENSDIDIMVDFEGPIRLEFVDLAECLETILGVTVDLVPRDAIKPNRWKCVAQDLLYV